MKQTKRKEINKSKFKLNTTHQTKAKMFENNYIHENHLSVS